jgi:hypothetical protein
VLGYLACHFASQRMVKAKTLEGGLHAPLGRFRAVASSANT